MSARNRTVALVALLLIILIVAVACGARAPAPAAPTANEAAPAPQVAVAPTMAPAALPPEQPQEDRGAETGKDLATPLPGQTGLEQPISQSAGVRKIIKDGEMNLVVANLTQSIDRVTTLAADSGGYVLSVESNTQGAVKSSTVKIGVPSDVFEDVMREVRGLALELRWERASGKDVTEEYVDLQSQLVNLEATQARLRTFLDEAKTVEEALKVNGELTRVEGDIEQIKGRMNYLRDRSAYSTLTVYLEQIAPTPTITPTPSITPTPTVTPTATPIVWNPTGTFDSARITLRYVLRGLGDIAIWAGVICVPLGIVALVLLVPLLAIRRRMRRRPARPAVAPPTPPPPAE